MSNTIASILYLKHIAGRIGINLNIDMTPGCDKKAHNRPASNPLPLAFTELFANIQKASRNDYQNFYKI
jgi:hypothetical protein